MCGHNLCVLQWEHTTLGHFKATLLNPENLAAHWDITGWRHPIVPLADQARLENTSKRSLKFPDASGTLEHFVGFLTSKHFFHNVRGDADPSPFHEQLFEILLPNHCLELRVLDFQTTQTGQHKLCQQLTTHQHQ